ncbi:MAG TPA: IS110 family transposase [Trebonia sp.]
MGNARRRKIPAQLVEDEEYQLRHERVAGIDIAKAKADVCTRLPPARDGGRRVSRLEEVPATAREILALAGRLLAGRVELVVMEATSDYWRIWYYLLEAAGLRVQLVNPAHARQLAGRPKTDRLDAQWIARLAEMGLLRPSFVPPPEIRALRDLTRTRLMLVRDRTREWQRLEKLLEGALVKLSSAVHSLSRTKTARDILEAMADGQRDPKALAALAARQVKGGRAAIEQALDGMMPGSHHPRLIRIHLDCIDLLDRSVAAIEDEIEAALDSIPAARGVSADGVPSADPGPGAAALPAAERLAEIPGVSRKLAMAIIAETGLDMTRFPTADHLASWAGLTPVARQSGPRNRKPGKGHGDAYLKSYCTQAANGAAGTPTFLGERLRRLSRRLGGNRAKCAVARSILVIIWHLLADPEARFTDLGPDWHERKTDRDRKIRAHLRQLQALGLEVTLTPAT